MEIATFFATERTLHKVWTIAYQHVSETEVKLLFHNNNVQFGYENEKKLFRFDLVEDIDRNVTGVFLSPFTTFALKASIETGIFYTVVNPRNVFEYNDFQFPDL